MNKEAIRRVANAIAKAARSRRGLAGVVGFNMANWISDTEDRVDYVDSCGTVACIAGWTIIAEDEGLADDAVSNLAKVRFGQSWFSGARDILGLDFLQADKLFSGGGAMGLSVISRSPSEAIATLRHLAATGEVVWFPEPVGAGLESST